MTSTTKTRTANVRQWQQHRTYTDSESLTLARWPARCISCTIDVAGVSQSALITRSFRLDVALTDEPWVDARVCDSATALPTLIGRKMSSVTHFTAKWPLKMPHFFTYTVHDEICGLAYEYTCKCDVHIYQTCNKSSNSQVQVQVPYP